MAVVPVERSAAKQTYVIRPLFPSSTFSEEVPYRKVADSGRSMACYECWPMDQQLMRCQEPTSITRHNPERAFNTTRAVAGEFAPPSCIRDT
jgi:hypothetical protein